MSAADSFRGGEEDRQGLVAGSPSGLKAEASLRFDDAAGESPVCNSDLGISSRHALRMGSQINLDVADLLGAQRDQIQLVKQIVEIGTEFELGVLAQDAHARQAEGFAESGVHL